MMLQLDMEARVQVDTDLLVQLQLLLHTLLLKEDVVDVESRQPAHQDHQGQMETPV